MEGTNKTYAQYTLIIMPKSIHVSFSECEYQHLIEVKH